MASLNSPINSDAVVPDSSLTNTKLKNSSISIIGYNGISAGSVSLGDSLGIGISGILSLDSDLEAPDGTVIWDNGNNYVPINVFEANSIGGTGSNGLSISGATLGNDISIGISGLLSLDSGLESSAGTTIWDSANDYLPLAALEANSVGGTGSNGINVTGATLGSDISVGISGLLELDSGLESASGTTIWDDTNKYIPDASIESSSFLSSVEQAANNLNWRNNDSDIVMQLTTDTSGGNSGDLTIEGEFTEGAAL